MQAYFDNNGPNSYFNPSAIQYAKEIDEFEAESEYTNTAARKIPVKEATSVTDFTEKLLASLAGNPIEEETDVDTETVGGKKHFRLRRDPYDKDCFFYKKNDFTIDEGITVLVGCNGSGKTTLMMLMKEYLRRKGNPLILEYSDNFDGRSMGIEKQMYNNRMEIAATMMCSSEGERIWMNVSSFIGDIGRAVRKSKKKDIWIFLDGIDSGMSIDNIIEMKEFFHELPTFEPDKHFYFIISANAFELACGEKCLDVANIEYVTFSNYEEYKRFVLASREQKKIRDKTEE